MKTSDMPVIELRGSPLERGRIYGELLRDNIAIVIDSWLSDLGSYDQNSQAKSSVQVETYLNAFFSQTNYLKAINQYAPDLVEEIQGIAQASGQAFEHVLGLNLMDEEWVFGLRKSLDKPVSKCTAFGMPKLADGTCYAGQNMDIGSWAEGQQVLLRIMPVDDAPEALVFSIAGSIGLNGVNANGLGVTCNTLSQLQFASDGLPVLFILRALLAKRSINDAEQLLYSIKHASGQNYMLSTADEIRCFECCGNSVVCYRPECMHGRVFHTNHPLVDFESSPIAELNKFSSSSIARLNSITKRLGG